MRELKTRLGKYLRAVRSGTTITLTERGVPIARLSPLSGEDEGIEAVLNELEAAGILSKGTGKIVDDVKAIKLKGEAIDQTISRGREDRF